MAATAEGTAGGTAVNTEVDTVVASSTVLDGAANIRKDRATGTMEVGMGFFKKSRLCAKAGGGGLVHECQV